MEEMPGPKKKYNEDFRRRYLLGYLSPDDPKDMVEREEYEEAYFSDPTEAEKLIRAGDRLLYEYVLGRLPAIDKESFRRMSGVDDKTQPVTEKQTLIRNKLREVGPLPVEELERRLKELGGDDGE